MQIDRLPEGKHMLVTVVAHQSLDDRLDRGLAASVVMHRKQVRIALAGDNRAQDLHAGDAGNVGNDMTQIQV